MAELTVTMSFRVTLLSSCAGLTSFLLGFMPKSFVKANGKDLDDLEKAIQEDAT